jgi:thioesterase domain-containing protein
VEAIRRASSSLGRGSRHRTAPGLPGDEYNGWRSLAKNGVVLRWMDGTHGQMLQEPNIGQLAQLVREHLAGG